MAWRDTLSDPSFRGVPFKVSERAFKVGRRGPDHEYPRRDEPYAEDMGLSAGPWLIRAFVNGPDYPAERDALIEACARKGPGELVDRWRDVEQVVCRGCTLTESSDEGGIARFSLNFVKAGRNASPGQFVTRGQLIDPAATRAAEAIKEALEAAVQFRGRLSYTQVEAAAVLDGISAVLKRASDRVGVDALAGAAGENRRYLLELSNVAALIDDPARMADAIAGAVDSVARMEPTPKKRFERMIEISDVDRALRPTAATTVSRIAAASNQAAIASITRRSAAVEAAKALVVTSFESTNEADQARDDFVALIDSELDAAATARDDQVFRDLRQLLAVAIESITAKRATLAETISVTTPGVEPAEITAYRLYGDAERAAEIVDRNEIKHPSFISPALALSVLSDLA
jgi:prophage DNA circulation protein